MGTYQAKQKKNKQAWLIILAALGALVIFALFARAASAASPDADWQKVNNFSELCASRGNESQTYLVLSGAETLSETEPCSGKWSFESQGVQELNQGTWEELRSLSSKGGTVFLTPAAMQEPEPKPTEEPEPIKIEDTPPTDFYAGGVAWPLTAPYTHTVLGIIPEGKWGVEIADIETIVDTVDQVHTILDGRSATLWFYPIEVVVPIEVTLPDNFFEGGVAVHVPANATFSTLEVPAGSFIVTINEEDFTANNLLQVLTVVAGREATLWFVPAPTPKATDAPKGFTDGGVAWPFDVMNTLPMTQELPALGHVVVEIDTVQSTTSEWTVVISMTTGMTGTLFFVPEMYEVRLPLVVDFKMVSAEMPTEFCQGGVPWVLGVNQMTPNDNPCSSGDLALQKDGKEFFPKSWEELRRLRVRGSATLWFSPIPEPIEANLPQGFCNGGIAWNVQGNEILPVEPPCSKPEWKYLATWNDRSQEYSSWKSVQDQHNGTFFTLWYFQ